MQTLVFNSTLKTVKVYEGTQEESNIVYSFNDISTVKPKEEGYYEVIQKESRVNFLRHTIGADLDLISNDVDLVFTTASTSSLEFLAREIPMGVACAIDNQVDFYEQLGSLGCALQIGSYGSDGKWRLNMHSIRELLESQALRESLRRTIDSLVDNRGAVRVMNSLLSLAASQEG